MGIIFVFIVLLLVQNYNNKKGGPPVTSAENHPNQEKYLLITLVCYVVMLQKDYTPLLVVVWNGLWY